MKIGVIGGSGVYDMQSLTDIEEVMPKTPFGDPSDAIVVGTLGGRRVAFLPRHGRGHRITPTELNSRANIFALKSLGVERIVAISACGSLREPAGACGFPPATGRFESLRPPGGR